ncbi:small GTP-binding protein [Histomonas meleagridis]|uniref:small GTP-binding protein n=1 Tax=Histomonas meleagridis TaxID=135588 RepID=UPI00355959D2|nr:small GTP-binding protein [Histomonas meleagridis]KAH0800050.1 small GTP-binding protein [Histomonas meleagridis]
MNTIKIVLVGDTRVGKSCLLSKFVQGSFDKDMPATIGAAFFIKIIQTPNGNVRLQLWDTAGQEQFRSLAPMYYRSASVAVLVFDLTSKSTLDGLDEWAAEILDKAPPGVRLVVIGNKLDLKEERVIPEHSGRAVANKFGAVLYGETSAKTGEGIQEIFSKIAELDITNEVVQEVSKTFPEEKKGCCE